MGEIHQLILRHGRDAAKQLVSPEERRLVDIAAQVLACDDSGIGVTYSGFCLTALPHKRLAEEEIWERKTPRITLLVEPGHFYEGETRRLFGVPYGSRARLILLYLQTQAVRTNSPEVELGPSMRAWMERMGVQAGGKNYREIREQSARLSACRLTFFWPTSEGRGRGFSKESIVESGIQLYDLEDEDGQARLWVDTVRLSSSFYRALKEHPVPIWEPAVKQISNQSMAIDVYIWLSYRLHVLDRQTSVTWTALHGQFGAGYKLIRQFKPRFIDSLQMAMAVYPEARITINDTGLVLHPSPPPIPERELRRLL